MENGHYTIALPTTTSTLSIPLQTPLKSTSVSLTHQAR